MAGPVSHQESPRWMSSLYSVLLQSTKAAGGGRGRGGSILAAGNGLARAEGGSASAVREQWPALLLESLSRISAWALEKPLMGRTESWFKLLSTPAAPDFICD